MPSSAFEARFRPPPLPVHAKLPPETLTPTIQMKIQHLALALALALAACTGGSSDPKALNDDGYQKISANDYEGAKSDFQAAATALESDTANPQYKSAKLGLVEALAHLDAAKAQKEFMTLAGALGDKIHAEDYSYIGGVLVSAGDAKAGLTVVHAGIEKFESDPGLKEVLAAIMAKASSDPELTSALGGLGYL